MTLKILFRGMRIMVKYNDAGYEIINYTESTKIFKIQSMDEVEEDKTIVEVKIGDIELA